MKIILGIVALLALGLITFMFVGPEDEVVNNNNQNSENVNEANDEREGMNGATEVTDGEYTVNAEQSNVTWAGKKPLIGGYINSGSIAMESGTITVADQKATGMFTIDMETLSVSETPTKPGQESNLEGHLKSEQWFDVATYPTATFEITEVTPRADSSTSFIYDIKGDLTMKGQTHEVTFPANIYQDANGVLHAGANFEFDRTQWGITAGSGSFFDNLEDNVIDDMVNLSFELVAEKN